MHKKSVSVVIKLANKNITVNVPVLVTHLTSLLRAENLSLGINK